MPDIPMLISIRISFKNLVYDLLNAIILTFQR